MSNKDKISAMRQGGKLLAGIKKVLAQFAQKEHNLEGINQKAEKLIKKTGGKPSLKMVEGYHLATCINVNSGVVHGIPQGFIKKGDLVTIDIGLYYQGFHTDTSTTFVIGKATKKQQTFLILGKNTLKAAIAQALPGNKIKNISKTIQTRIESKGSNVVRELTGHGIGQELHEKPPIPCFVSNSPEMNYILQPNTTLAIEVMYTQGDWPLITSSDDWTLKTKDNSLAAVFEETILVTSKGPKILTIT